MNETLQSIKNRRSTRAYTQEQIKDEELNAILEAGMYAPSAGNQQPWHFTVLKSKEIMTQMNQEVKEYFSKSEIPHFQKIASNEKFNAFYNAPLAVIISGDEKAMLPNIDCAAATENILIAAESLGIGTCWIQSVIHLFNGTRANEWKTKLGIPEGYKPLYAVSLGYKSKEGQNEPPRKENKVNYIN